MSVEYINFICETRDTRNALPTSPRTVCLPFHLCRYSCRVLLHVYVLHVVSRYFRKDCILYDQPLWQVGGVGFQLTSTSGFRDHSPVIVTRIITWCIIYNAPKISVLLFSYPHHTHQLLDIGLFKMPPRAAKVKNSTYGKSKLMFLGISS
jgi:hypothetical protein